MIIVLLKNIAIVFTTRKLHSRRRRISRSKCCSQPHLLQLNHTTSTSQPSSLTNKHTLASMNRHNYSSSLHHMDPQLQSEYNIKVSFNPKYVRLPSPLTNIQHTILHTFYTRTIMIESIENTILQAETS